jgi:hypothetical protein
MSNEPSAHHPVEPDAEPPIAPALGADDIVVGHDDLSIIVEAASTASTASPAEPRVAGAEDLRAMSERLRRVEEELDGVFQTIGRLLRGGDASDPQGRRFAADAIHLEIEKRLGERGSEPHAGREGERPAP